MPETLFLIKLQASDLQLSQKEYQAQVFSCAFCKNVFKNTFIHRTPPVTASVYKQEGIRSYSIKFCISQILFLVFSSC